MLVVKVWFVERVGIVCLLLFLATALILPQFTTLCPIWAGQRKTQQTFVEWFDCALLLPLNIPKQSLSIFPMQNPGRNMPIFC